MSNLRDYFPVWNKLNKTQQDKLEATAIHKSFKEGDIVHNGTECSGFLIVKSGQLRAHISSEEGREITVYRLFERDTCMFSGTCMMNSLQFDITIETEKPSEVWLIPPLAGPPSLLILGLPSLWGLCLITSSLSWGVVTCLVIYNI